MAVDTKTRLLDAAEARVRRRGFDGFSYADIAGDVGIRKASVHHHFPTKAAMSVALIARYRFEMERFLTGVDGTSAASALERLIARYRAALGEGEQLCLCVALLTGRESLPPDALHEIASYRAMVTTWLRSSFAKGMGDGTVTGILSPTDEAAATLALLEGAQLAGRVANDPDAFDRATAVLSARLRA